ncbi:Predicted nicotinamide N-methyase [Micromonospora inyonensis]|uniref:Predicted nicotinamide N-methyase n=2 Tax=Micromonospora inyonensis TaxID=47866 RepID=A0A1C6S3N6_9ACTN|nr:Predicted nicotinamide N-methyase [Micromonospora inyonensis]
MIALYLPDSSLPRPRTLAEVPGRFVKPPRRRVDDGMLARMDGATRDAAAALRREIHAPGHGPDRLRLAPTPLVPEVRLHVAEDAILWWARMEAAAGHRLPAPYWASAWAGGQALARYLLDHPRVAAGRRVLDLATGSGLVAIAAALTGAAQVRASDIDPYAVAAVGFNAHANRVAVDASATDLLDTDGGDVDLLLAGDVFYDRPMTDRVLPFLERVAARGVDVLVGDPGRGYLPEERLEALAVYRVPSTEVAVEAPVRRVRIMRPRRRPG